ncbi:Ig-like domain-containing protein [Vitiosangium sp. GDMCC 1.1324]|uniref:Ig-like domain-containing protein n=1 Tax=Vitiosangium sp. (strain GDMCC 1.1324) TaxID=2138576 RepID=UPI00130DDEC1|nr:Ig-like domain-containing protein [Vitiosangium sp. GDMCC 1.1324]
MKPTPPPPYWSATVVLLGVLGLGCPSTPPSYRVRVTPETVTYSPSTKNPGLPELEVAAVLEDPDGNPVPGTSFSWSSSDDSIASFANVSEQGRAQFRAYKSGCALLTAEADSPSGKVSGTSRATIRYPEEIRPQPSGYLLTPGEAFSILLDSSTSVKPVTWTTTDAAVATVDEQGRVTARGPGHARIMASSSPRQGCESSWTVSSSTEVEVRPTPLRFSTVQASSNLPMPSACALDAEGRLHCWGAVAGLSPAMSCVVDFAVHPPIEISCQTVPLPVTEGVRFTQLAHRCGLTDSGQVRCWEKSLEAQPPPLPTAPLSQLSAGSRHSCGLTSTGQAWCWGNNSLGQLGVNDFCPGPVCGDNQVPSPVAGDLRFTRIDSGSDHTCALDADNQAWCWGADASGQLGGGAVSTQTCRDGAPCATSPRAVVGKLAFQDIDAAMGTTCGLTTSGELYCWGQNLGPTPTRMEGLPAFVSLEEGCGLTAEGKAYCTGTQGGLLATPVAPELRWRSLSWTVSGFFCGLTTEGVAYCGGSENRVGELGNGTGGITWGVNRGLAPVLGQ